MSWLIVELLMLENVSSLIKYYFKIIAKYEVYIFISQPPMNNTNAWHI